MAPRASLYQALLRPGDAGFNEKGRRNVAEGEVNCEWGKKVINTREVGVQVVLEYADGTVDWADLVVGADGLQSVVRDAVSKGGCQAKYGGLAGVSGLIDIKSLPPRFRESLKEHGVAITLGRRGCFGYSRCTPLPPSSNHSLTSDSELPLQLPNTANINYEDIKAQLLSVHGDWKSPYDALDSEKSGSGSVFRSIIEQGCRGPLNSFGASCAIEDSLTYALLLKHYLSISPSYNARNPTDVETGMRETPFALTANAFKEVRRPRIRAFTDMVHDSCEKADERTEMGWLGEKLRDWAIRWLAGKAPEKMNDYLFSYDTEAAVKEYLAKKESVEVMCD
ncbi:hypothetical protein NLJ89_g4994 [Agrocybe chaxingu]|uniref:FAD-binding domain-containing protein n=1 Tax=Agrocybe chaxingu TaxID=84603 RepID=A0A9W8MX94_9AGAR|nr:hypothetical protein NLJ89_g4994 [Agrocybe chaxingu]